MNRKRKSTTLWWGTAVILLVVILLFAGRTWRQNRALAAETNNNETVTVTTGDLAATVSAGGRVVAQRQASLSLAQSGRVQAVPVSVGDTVRAGDTLVQLETATLERSLDNARQSVAIQEANLAELRQGPSAAELAASEAQLASVQAQLDGLPDEASDSQRAAAEAQLAQAQASLANLRRNPTAERLAIVQAQLTQARNGLAEAEDNLARATLVAPFAGLVTAVNVTPGEMAGGVAVELVDMDSLEVALDVDEVDIGALSPGQTAVITLDSYPGQEIESYITTIAPQANSGSEAVTYRVYLSLEDATLPLRIGMTANARLIIAERDNILLAPNRAITADRAAGKYYVNRLQNSGESDTVQRVEVTIGLRDGQYTEITTGLASGDRLLVGELPTRNQLPGRGPFGGGP